jgi:hypothetical protein
MSGRILGVAAGLMLGAATAAVTTAGVAAAAANAPQPAAAAHWHIVKSVKTNGNGNFTAEVATGKTTGWAFEGLSSPTAWRLSGGTWTKVAFPGESSESVIAAGASSPSDVWAFTDISGAGSRVLRWNGHHWSVMATFDVQIGGASVVASNDVWLFGRGTFDGLGVWHFDGQGWTQVGKNGSLMGGSALSATDAWAFDATHVYHWNPHIHQWDGTLVTSLLPPKQALNNPSVTGIIALAANNVYAIGNGNRQDAGGPVVVLHYDGHTWAKVAEGSFSSYGTGQQISSDGSGGLWLPMPGASGSPSSMVHYAAGQLTQVPLPVSGNKIRIDSVANIPGTTQDLAGGLTHAASNPASRVVAVILRFS